MSSIYDIMRVPKQASTNEIRTKYHLLCRGYHPTRDPSDAQHFAEVQKACYIQSQGIRVSFIIYWAIKVK